ncbi:COG3650 family protein [Stutzerimonas xanthomarina]|uniref:COG3650 family protein n=1 Tax=Stutzerimonas xanthomarina TaxID=271420 RepID=UPI003AA97291
MKALRIPAAILTAALLQACAGTPSGQPADKPAPQASLTRPDSIHPQRFVLRGQVVLGHQVRSFTPCGSQQQLWLDLPEELSQQAMALNQSPYQIMYGEMIGYLAPPSQTGYNGDYTARFVVQQINRLSAENPDRCDLVTTPTRAFGTEPFWSMSFSNQGLTFQPVGGEKQTFTIEEREISEQSRHYQFDGGELSLTRGTCSDNMSDTLYGWQAELELNGGEYRGCATLGNQDATLGWTGTYFASATHSNGFSVTLNLNGDHSATTRYHYSDGSADTVESGYWQQLSDQQVQVVMTRHQQQYLLSQRIFTREDNRLTATHEQVGTLVYPINDGGLVLYSADNASLQSDKHSTDHTTQLVSSDRFEEDVDQAVRRYFALHDTATEGSHYRWLKYDLNGDAKPELLVQLDWCGSGGCTLLVFQHQQQEWRFNSRITLINTPFQVADSSSHGWQDLLLPVRGGGANAAVHRLQYNGISYPLNPSTAKPASSKDSSSVTLFADGLSPHQSGVAL